MIAAPSDSARLDLTHMCPCPLLSAARAPRDGTTTRRQSIAQLRHAHGGRDPDFVVGRIILIDVRVAGATQQQRLAPSTPRGADVQPPSPPTYESAVAAAGGGAPGGGGIAGADDDAAAAARSNPYGLHVGTTFYVLHVEKI